MYRSNLADGMAARRQTSKGANPVFAPFVCLSLLAAIGFPAHANQWSYPGDPGFVARSQQELPAAKASWETPEYGNFTGILSGSTINAPWQLVAVNASTAYALGYYGQGVT